MTYIELVQEEATKLGLTVDAARADDILWEHTGFPGFYPTEEGESTEDCLRRQVREYLKEPVKK